MHLFRDSVDKAKFWLYAQRVALGRQQISYILAILDSERLGIIDCAVQQRPCRFHYFLRFHGVYLQLCD